MIFNPSYRRYCSNKFLIKNIALFNPLLGFMTDYKRSEIVFKIKNLALSSKNYYLAQAQFPCDEFASFNMLLMHNNDDKSSNGHT